MMNGRKKPSSTSIMFQSYLAPSSTNLVDQQVKAISKLLNDHHLWNSYNEGAILQNLHFVNYILNALERLDFLPNPCFNQTNVDQILDRPENFGAEKSLWIITAKTEESLASSSSSSSSDTEEEEEESLTSSSSPSSSDTEEEKEEESLTSSSSSSSSDTEEEKEEESLTSSSSSSSSDTEEEEEEESLTSSSSSSSSDTEEEEEEEVRRYRL